MNDRQENQTTMMYAVKELADLNNAVWSTDAPFSASYGLFTAQLTIIDTQRPLQVTNTKGAAVDKKNKRTALEDQTFFVANRIHSFAVATNNQALLATIDYTRSDLDRARDTSLLGIAKLVKDTGTTNLASLATYGITAAVLTALNTATTNFQNIVSGPRVAKAAPVAASKILATAINTAMALLDTRLDVDVEVFKGTNLTFYNQYKAAREIIDLTTSPLALVCTVKDVSGNVMANVTALITEGNISKTTTDGGNFQLRNLAAGTYHTTFSKNGFVSQSITFFVNDGETTKLNVVMVAV